MDAKLARFAALAAVLAQAGTATSRKAKAGPLAVDAVPRLTGELC